MRRGADDRRASPVALLPMAIVAAAVLVLAVLVSGVLWKRTLGTIVVEHVVMRSTSTEHNPPVQYALTTITETSASGRLERIFTTISATRPGYQQVEAGSTMQLYDPSDNTVYVTTQAAWQRAALAQERAAAPKGSQVAVTTVKLKAVGQYFPGRTSVYDQELLAHRYRVVRRTTIEGRPVLELTQTRPTALNTRGSDFESDETAYLNPRTHDPVEAAITTKLPGVTSTTIDRWLTYAVLPATRSNQRLVSLTARHPGARVVNSALGFLRASQQSQTSG